MTKELKIEQVDREAAWHYADFHCLPDIQMSDRWFSGYYDNLDQGHAIRAFARHRLSTRTPPALDGLAQPLRSALRFAASHSRITSAQEQAILTALSGAGWQPIESAPKDDLVERLERKATYTDNWFNNSSLGEAYREAATRITTLEAENAALRAANAALVEALHQIEGQAVCCGMPADEAELRDWLRNIAEIAELTKRRQLPITHQVYEIAAQHGEKNDG